MTAFVSNGNGTPRVLDYLRPWIDLYKVDLKSFDDRHYRQLGGRLEPDPGDDSRAARDGHLARDRDAADPRLQRLAGRDRSPDEFRRRRFAGHPVARHGVPQGLPHERSGEHDAGDADARRRDRDDATACATCMRGTCPGGSAISRTRAATTAARCSSSATATSCCSYRLTSGGGCPDCGTPIPGRWASAFEGQIASTPFLPGACACARHEDACRFYWFSTASMAALNCLERHRASHDLDDLHRLTRARASGRSGTSACCRRRAPCMRATLSSTCAAYFPPSRQARNFAASSPTACA